MLNFTFTQSVKILTGANSVTKIGELLVKLHYQKAFLVFDQGIRNVGIIDTIETSLRKANVDFIEYDKVVPDPPAEIIDQGATLCKEKNCDCVIAIGGGSSIDTGKGINILRFNEGHILDYATKEMKKCSGLIAIPTTSGTGSELSNGAIISDLKNDSKVPILCFNNMPEYSILDPELTLGIPYNPTLLTGLDVFSHAAESYTSKNANPMTDLICEKIMQTVVENLPIVLKNPHNLDSREKMQCSASMAGWMLYSASAHIGHSIAHVLGAHWHLIHGAACAYSLPAVLKAVSIVFPQKIKYIGQLLNASYTGNESNEEIGIKASDAFQKFTRNLALTPMPNFKLDEEKKDILIQKIIQEPLAQLSPIEINTTVVEKMLNDILR